MKRIFERILAICATFLFAMPLLAQESVYRPPFKWVCQWEEGNSLDQGCTGMIGLMRLSRSNLMDYPGWRKQASKALFGSEDLPAIGAEVVIQRSAHLRREYWPDRDDQSIDQNQKICNRVGCLANSIKRLWCSATVGENSEKAVLMRRTKRKFIDCPGPTDKTEYFAAGTVVKILGNQQTGSFFVLVQIVKIESTNPEEDEKRYRFDRREVI